MRNKLILKAVGVILLVISVSFSASALMNGNSDGNTITIHNVSHELQGGPRSVVPFYAEYNDLMNTVMLGCSDSLGDVTVRLESTAGDWYQTVFDTEDGMILIPASGDEGYYTLTIVTSDNTTYQGEFVL